MRTTYRSLLKRPFFCAVIFTLTLGIGANSAIFSLITPFCSRHALP